MSNHARWREKIRAFVHRHGWAVGLKLTENRAAAKRARRARRVTRLAAR